MSPPPAAQRLSSQRATAEFRGVEAECTELRRQLTQRNEELRTANEYFS